MAKVSRDATEVNARIVYWGCEGAGTSENLRAAFAKLRPDHRGEIKQVPTRIDPTVGYELLPITLGEIAGTRTQIEMVAVVDHSRAFELGRLAGFKPEPARLRDGDAVAIGGVSSRSHVHGDRRVVGVGITFTGEGLEVAVAALVNVIDYPGFLRFARTGLPISSSDGHRKAPPVLLCSNMT